MQTFLPNRRLMRPLSLVKKQTKLTDIVLFCLNPLKLKSFFLFLTDMLLSGYILDIGLPYEYQDTYRASSHPYIILVKCRTFKTI